MTDIIAAMIIIFLVTAAALYIIKEKKKGSHCIGCPMAKSCARAKLLKDGESCRTQKVHNNC